MIGAAMTDGDFTTYGAQSTSRRTAIFEPVEIALRENPDGSQRRLALKVSAVEDPPTAGATLRATFVYQHRRRADEDWTEDNFNLATLRAGQEVRIELHSAETLRVFTELQRLYAASAGGIRRGRYAVTVTDADAPVSVVPKQIAEQIREMLESEGPGVFEVIAQMRPDLARWAALVEEHRLRAADLSEFEERLADDPPAWDERRTTAGRTSALPAASGATS
jgi:hypothetical protein